MAVSPDRLLVVTLDGSLDGHQLFLLYLLRWLAADTGQRCHLHKGGP